MSSGYIAAVRTADYVCECLTKEDKHEKGGKEETEEGGRVHVSNFDWRY